MLALQHREMMNAFKAQRGDMRDKAGMDRDFWASGSLSTIYKIWSRLHVHVPLILIMKP